MNPSTFLTISFYVKFLVDTSDMVIAFALYNTENDAYFVLYDTLFMG